MKMLQDSLKSSISVDNDTRVYVIVSGTENNEEHSYGRFIFGKRKINAPWKDYGYEEATEDRV